MSMRHRKSDRAPRHRVASGLFAAAALFAAGMASRSAAAEDLPIWDQYSYANQAQVMKTLNGKFEADHAGVALNRTERTFDDLGLTLRLAVSAGDGPVVTQVNQGAKDMGAMAKDSLLMPLDDQAGKYDWKSRYSQSILARSEWLNGKEFGKGSVYGVSSLGEIVGLYYNKRILQDSGVELPLKSFEDFQAALGKVKQSGQTPLAIGTAKNNLALHLFAGIAQASIDAADRGTLDDVIYGRGGTWNTPGNVGSAKLMQDWAKNGYFADGFQGTSGDDAVQLFIAGQGAFLVSGTWYLGDVKDNPDIGFTTIPAPKGVAHPLSVGGVDPAWGMTSLAKDDKTKELAASYIDFMASPEAAAEWAKAGYLPAVALADDAKVDASPLLAEALQIWKTLNANDAIGHYPDWSSPSMLKTIDDNMPLLLAGQQSPEDFVGKMQADYAAYLSGR